MGRWVVICPCMWRTIPVFLVAASGSSDWVTDHMIWMDTVLPFTTEVSMFVWCNDQLNSPYFWMIGDHLWSVIGLSNCQLRLTKYPRSRCFRATAGHLATVAAVCVAAGRVWWGPVEAEESMLSSQSLWWVFIGENSRIWYLDDFQASQIYMFFFLGSDRTTFFYGTPFILFTFSHLCSVGLWWLPRSSSLGRPWFFVPWRLWRSCWPAAVHLGDGTKRRHIRNANHQSFITVSSHTNLLKPGGSRIATSTVLRPLACCRRPAPWGPLLCAALRVPEPLPVPAPVQQPLALGCWPCAALRRWDGSPAWHAAWAARRAGLRIDSFSWHCSSEVQDLQAFWVSGRAKQYWEGEWICADCGYIYNECLGVQHVTITALPCTCSRRTDNMTWKQYRID